MDITSWGAVIPWLFSFLCHWTSFSLLLAQLISTGSMGERQAGRRRRASTMLEEGHWKDHSVPFFPRPPWLPSLISPLGRCLSRFIGEYQAGAGHCKAKSGHRLDIGTQFFLPSPGFWLIWHFSILSISRSTKRQSVITRISMFLFFVKREWRRSWIVGLLARRSLNLRFLECFLSIISCLWLIWRF